MSGLMMTSLNSRSDNEISTIEHWQWDAVRRVRHVDLARNYLTSIGHAKAMGVKRSSTSSFDPFIRHLFESMMVIHITRHQRVLDGNDFGLLQENAFSEFHTLDTLSLSSSQIEIIDQLAFAGLDNLRHLLAIDKVTVMSETCRRTA